MPKSASKRDLKNLESIQKNPANAAGCVSLAGPLLLGFLRRHPNVLSFCRFRVLLDILRCYEASINGIAVNFFLNVLHIGFLQGRMLSKFRPVSTARLPDGARNTVREQFSIPTHPMNTSRYRLTSDISLANCSIALDLRDWKM